MSAEVQRITAARVVHIDVPAISEQRLALLGVAERGMAALVDQVIGLGLDDPCAQPQRADAMADDLAEQLAGQQLCVAIEKGIGQRPGAGPGQAEVRFGRRHLLYGGVG